MAKPTTSATIDAFVTRINNIAPDELRAAPFNLIEYKATSDAQQIAALTDMIMQADWVCYQNPVDRLDYPRGLHIVTQFPQGFKVYAVEVEGDQLPIGYSGWLPITQTVFETMANTPHKLTHRGQITAEMPADSRYFYFFNVSIIEPLHKTPQSRQLLANHAAVLPQLGAKGIAAVTLSEHGIRAVTRFGMEYRGEMTHDGDSEAVYAAYL